MPLGVPFSSIVERSRESKQESGIGAITDRDDANHAGCMI
jgi:hypothetical protein